MSTPQPAPVQPGPAGSQPNRGMLAPSFTFMKVRGIRIGAHWSWLIVFSLVSWSLARSVFPFAYPGLSGTAYLVMAVVSALIFFVCILLHELGHAFRAIKEGMKMGDITLWLFGGVARFQGMFPSAGAEFRIAAAGPAVSVVLVVLFGAVTWIGSAVGLPAVILGMTDYLARINLAVVVFNLVPALPLDGGRILRSWLWSRKGNFTKATISAARFGKAFAYVLMTLGVFEFFSTSPTGGIWFVVMGWFLLQAAQAEQNYAVVRQAFQDTTVRSLMTPDPAVVGSETTVAEFLDLVQRRGHSTYPVVDDGALKGMVSFRMAAEVPFERRSTARVADLMVEPLVFAGTTPVVEAIDPLRAPPGRGVVLDDGRLAGILSLSDVARALEIRSANGNGRPDRPDRNWALLWAAVALLLPIALAIYRPPVVIVAPAPAVDVTDDVEIDGVPVTDLEGRYLLVAVSVVRPNAIRAALSYLNPDVEVLPQRNLLPEGVSEPEYLQTQQRVFEESQMAAAAAAAQAAGLEVTLRGNGAQILEVVEGSPAEGKLRAGDVIVSVDGKPIRLVSDLLGITTVRPAGTEFVMEVERGTGRTTVRVNSARLSNFNSSNTGVGIVTTTKDLDVDLPFEVEFRNRQIGGPSAGLIYALLIADMLQNDDVADGRDVAATGTIQLNGRVGPVGGLEEKLRAAEDAGADVFLVPRSELDDVSAENRRTPVRTLGVETLQEAMAVLNGQA
ncbi:MAG TPA: site-2 protease family protein [Actinomycetota bacterium]|nr:site-2 protease family protein [Actinomycetota bacterium]